LLWLATQLLFEFSFLHHEFFDHLFRCERKEMTSRTRQSSRGRTLFREQIKRFKVRFTCVFWSFVQFKHKLRFLLCVSSRDNIYRDHTCLLTTEKRTHWTNGKLRFCMSSRATDRALLEQRSFDTHV
jgi:hypothetical protein